MQCILFTVFISMICSVPHFFNERLLKGRPTLASITADWRTVVVELLECLKEEEKDQKRKTRKEEER